MTDRLIRITTVLSVAASSFTDENGGQFTVSVRTLRGMRELTHHAVGTERPPEQGVSGAEAQMTRDRRRAQALLLGGIDMLDVIETAQYLTRDDTNIHWRVRRTLEAGMFVSYARSFVGARGAGLPKLKRASNLSEGLLDSHEQIIRRRNAVYAHTDQTDARQMLQLTGNALAQWTFGEGELLEQWDSPTLEMLHDTVVLAQTHLGEFFKKIQKIQKRIGSTSVLMTR